MNLLATWVSRSAAFQPDAPALMIGGDNLNYRLLRDRMQALAQPAQAAGLVRQAGSAAELAMAAYAASARGRPFFPLGPASLTAISDPVPAGIELLIATSGTQGEPRAVMLSGANLAASVAASRARLPLQPGDVWLDCLPLYHIGGMAILYRCAQAGAAVLLHEGFDAGRVWADLSQRQVTHVSLVPAMLALLLELTHGAPPPSALKYVLVGGGALTAALAARARAAGWPLCATYGMSETASQLATLCPLPEDWEPGCVGMPLPGFEVRIAGGSCGGDAGVIQARGAAVMAGYAHADGEPGHGIEDSWLTTGDIGKIDVHGQLHVLGRADDMLVSGGANVHPATVEACLLGAPGVSEAGVTALPDEIWGDRLVALVVGQAEAEQVDAWCRKNLAGAQRPRLVWRVDALPRNALGKLERKKIRKMAQELASNDA